MTHTAVVPTKALRTPCADRHLTADGRLHVRLSTVAIQRSESLRSKTLPQEAAVTDLLERDLDHLRTRVSGTFVAQARGTLGNDLISTGVGAWGIVRK